MRLILLLSLVMTFSSCGNYFRVPPEVKASKISWLEANTDLNQPLEDIDAEYNLDVSANFTPSQQADHDIIQAWYDALADGDFSTAENLTSTIPNLSTVHSQSRATLFYGLGIVTEAAFGSAYGGADSALANSIFLQLRPDIVSQVPTVNNADISIVEEISRLLLWKSYFKVLRDAGGNYNALVSNYANFVASNVISTFTGRPNSSSALILTARQYVGIEVIKASNNLSPLGNWASDIALYNSLFGNVGTLNVNGHVLPMTADLDLARDTVATANGNTVHDWLVTGGTLSYGGSLTLIP